MDGAHGRRRGASGERFARFLCDACKELEAEVSGGSGRVLEGRGSSLACRGAARGSNLAGAVGLPTAEKMGTGRHWGEGVCSSASPLRAEAAEARRRGRTRAGGGLGGQETASNAMATRRAASGRGREVGDDLFAENPLPPLFSVFFFISF